MSEDTPKTASILVVDDTPTNLDVLFDFLNNAGFKVLFAEDGESALEKARYANPDLILLDILMPGMDGFETCRRLKQQATTAVIPVIFLTALTETTDKVKGLALGAVDFITKPLQYEEVLARVKTHLRLQSLTQQVQARNMQLEREVQERTEAEAALQRQNQRSQLFADVTLKIRQSLQIDDILQTAVTEVKTILHADRVLIYRLWPDGTGSGVAEAVQPHFPQVMGVVFPQEVFPTESREQYRQGRIRSLVNAALDQQVSPCLVEFLQQFEVQAKLVVPILTQDDLWGLLIAHQCAGPRQWTVFETELLQQLADQIAIALTQAQLLEQETLQRQELARSNAELQQFAYIASHDLQEPLRMVTSYLQLLERRYKGQLDPDADDFIQFAVDGALRMRTLINDLLTYSRIGTRGHAFQLTSCNAAVEQAIANLQLAIEESGAVVTYPDLPQLQADPTQLIQLFQNLISNAIKFRGEAPVRVAIAVSQMEDAWLFSVQDNGIGLDPQYADQIFVIFQRLNNRTHYPGTGIGLAVCKKIVERHGGKIWVEAALDQGATFYFTMTREA
ncbi:MULTISPECIES: response regulator [Cyanophyceae]|uniref:response regulator n=1 Tax=Cyanophyceae TaxID=3028117 RepID=UPI0016853415|nr:MULTISPECIES: response regulator [Cyanophyceae]MBD1914758.1 response regulator [Phormidium sp. FACHB-77]MBD2030861.1 response regulator [Phormidium sp. FACHB-322]MBD2052460.1 response regulator [Leptolyngbya sp. FACHB-60]